MSTSKGKSSWFLGTTPEARKRNRYDAGRRAYEAGGRFDHLANIDWKRGFTDARDSGSAVDRHHARIGEPAPAAGTR